MKKIMKLAGILFLVCAIVAGVLGVVNDLTYPSIERQKNAATIAAYAAVLNADPATFEFEKVEFDPAGAAFAHVDAIVKDKAGTGYCVQTTVSGAQGLITQITGVDADYLCSGIAITTHSETSGLGAVAAEASEKGNNFRSQFIGQGEEIALSSKGGVIDGISGATITSNACCTAVAEAIQAIRALG